MKNILKVIAAAVFAAALFACSDKNPVNPTPLPPVPKPESPVETAAYAAKKADYFLRLAFDLADGYLYDNSVARKRYGTDSNYVNSLNFNEANGQGIIRSYALGSFEFWYYRDTIDASHSYDVKITTYPALSSGNTQEFKRDVVVNVASGANNGAKRYNILFTGTDT
ncbi:MAG: hypothetical protein LBQ47_03020, partial [Endomicrobium sp.]|nr:hypothetical protein [Endomicrobium sp.]